MRKALVLSILALCTAPAAAATNGHCDAIPFTLGKPAVAAPKAKASGPSPKAVASEVAPKKPQPRSEGKQRLLAACKSGKKKGG